MLSFLTLDEWQAFVESRSESTVFHHRLWIELIRDQYAAEVVIPAVVENGSVRAAMAFIESHGLFAAKRLICLPFTDYMRPLYSDRKSLDTLLRTIRKDFPSDYSVVVARTDQPFFEVATESPWVRHEVDTSSATNDVVSRFTVQARQNFRKAKDAGLEYRQCCDAAAIDEFYRLHLKTRKKVGVPIQPKGFFRLLHRRMIENGLGHTALVLAKGRVISASVQLQYNRTAMCKYFASDPRALAVRPNDFMTFHSITSAVENGYTAFDFGISKRKQHGLRRFKRKWGAVEIEVFYDQIVGESMTTPIDESAAMRIAGTAIRHSPELLCRTLGELFYRFGQ